MKKNSKRSFTNTNDFESLHNVTEDFEIFKSRIANAILDYIETQEDSELVECLEKTRVFLNNISFQMEKVLDNQEQALEAQKELSEIGDDLFSTIQHSSYNTIH